MMQLVQSFVYTISHIKLSLYEQRIMLKVVEFAQQRIKGMLIKDHLEALKHDYDNVYITIPIVDLLDEGNNHYDHVISAVRDLQQRILEYYDTTSRTWNSTPLIYNCAHREASGCIQFYVARLVFSAILDFSKGFREFSLENAISLPSPYAVRFYALMAGQDKPLTLTIDKLRAIFNVGDRYKQTADYIKKVVEPSRKILDAAACTSFTYRREREGKKVVALTFFPVKRDAQTPAQRAATQSVGWYLTQEVRIWLIQKAGFTVRELGAHKDLLKEFCAIPDAVSSLIKIYERFVSGSKSKGYIIAAMRSEVAEYKQPPQLQEVSN